MSASASHLTDDFSDSQMQLNELYQSVQQSVSPNASGSRHIAGSAQPSVNVHSHQKMVSQKMQASSGSHESASIPRSSESVSIMSDDELARVFNSAVVSTRTTQQSSLSTELMELAHSPAYRAILIAVRHHAADMGISEKVAAEQIIQTFRKLERTWLDYVFTEGLERIRSSG